MSLVQGSVDMAFLVVLPDPMAFCLGSKECKTCILLEEAFISMKSHKHHELCPQTEKSTVLSNKKGFIRLGIFCSKL
jgi:hypothetical protein